MLANIENIIEKKTFKYDLMGSKNTPASRLVWKWNNFK